MNIGIDIIENKRIKTKIKNSVFVNRILSKREILVFTDIKNKNEKVNYLSGRFSAKEAIIKASNKTLLFSNIEILNSFSGKPEVYYQGIKQDTILVSISHEKKYSIAVAIIN